jgi:Tfp pilus assembly protein PilF
MIRAEQSIAHSLTPDASYVLLAYLALRLGDADKVLTYASEAVRVDPRFSSSHWLMAEADLGKGDRKAAASEARLALSLNPHSADARSALKRATGAPRSTDNPEELVRYARGLMADGFLEKARLVLLRAVRKSGGHCVDCHSTLAMLYEQTGRNTDAVSEWQAYEREAPQQALAEKTALRIDRLKREGTQER